jgi:hypothetical protein
MSTSFSTITPGAFELSPCRITYNGVDLGGTDKVTLKIEEKLAPLKADQLGDSFIDQKVSGFKITIETALDETLLKSNWKVVFAAHSLVTEGGQTAFYFDSQVGQSMRALAKPLILHPLSKVDADKSSDVNVYLATANPVSSIEFSSQDQQKLKVTFDVYPDFTTQPPRWMLYGDPAVGLQNASAGPAIAATGNIGNGTVGSISVNNGTTETETITLQCLTAGTGANFSVSGTESGPLGIATNGLTFNAPNNQIAFLITGGMVNFALNDSFTIATVAANYV